MPPRRGPSAGGWGRLDRLRPVELDPLEVYGLPSKGETRLLDFKIQEKYYTKIIERYLAFCTDAADRDELLQKFASLRLEAPNVAGAGAGAGVSGPSSSSLGQGGQPRPSLAQLPPAKDLADIFMALRKLREAVVATARADRFAAQAYLFCIRLAVLARQPDAYHPAILHLLRAIHPRHPLTRLEADEVAAYLVLDAACRRADLAEAYRLRCALRLRSGPVDAVLAALAHDDWVAFRRLLARVDGHQACLLAAAEPDLRRHTLKCLGRAYLRLEDVAVLEGATGLGWADLQADYGVGWEREGRAVVIRKVQPRKGAAVTAAQ